MSPDQLFPLIIFAGVLVCTPGPANMLLMAAGARQGFAACVPLLVGVTLGKLFVHVSLALGLWRVMELYPSFLIVLKIAGALYVLWLAWKILHIKIQSGATGISSFLPGLAVHPLNPKAWAMVVSAYGQFIDASGHWWLQTLIIALVFFFWQCVSHTFWCWSGAYAVSVFSNDRRQKLLMYFFVAAMVAAVLWSLLN